MHGSAWVWQFEVKIFVHESGSMREVMSKIVSIHVVIVDEHSTVLVLWLEVEAHIIPVSWPDFVVIMRCVSHI